MSQHKAPTAVTIAPAAEKTGFGLWVDKYWKIGALVAVLLTGWILYRTNAKHTVRVEGDSNWSKLLAVAQEDSAKGVIAGPPAELRQVAEQLKGSPTAGWALYIGATSALADGKYDEAESLVKELESTYPNHPLVTLKLRDAEGAATTTVTARLASRIAAERDWIAAHPSLFDNPPLPADAPKVRLTTDRGPIVVGLYTDLAPEHANNFLKLVREGFYVGTKFHSIFAGEYIQGGDPNTKDKDKDPNTWGQGGPDYTQERKKSALRHFTGVISAVPVPGELTKTSGSQFLITTSSVHGLDETYVPFGKVLEGLDVVKEIEKSPVAESTFNRPKDPVAITAAEVL